MDLNDLSESLKNNKSNVIDFEEAKKAREERLKSIGSTLIGNNKVSGSDVSEKSYVTKSLKEEHEDVKKNSLMSMNDIFEDIRDKLSSIEINTRKEVDEKLIKGSSELSPKEINKKTNIFQKQIVTFNKNNLEILKEIRDYVKPKEEQLEEQRAEKPNILDMVSDKENDPIVPPSIIPDVNMNPSGLPSTDKGKKKKRKKEIPEIKKSGILSTVGKAAMGAAAITGGVFALTKIHDSGVKKEFQDKLQEIEDLVQTNQISPEEASVLRERLESQIEEKSINMTGEDSSRLGGAITGGYTGAKVGASLGAFAGPIGAGVGAVGGAVVGAVAGSEVGSAISNIMEDPSGFYDEAKKQTEKYIGDLDELKTNVVDSVSETLKPAIQYFETEFPALTETISKTKDTIQTTLLKDIPDAAGKALSGAKKFLDYTGISKVVSDQVDSVSKYVNPENVANQFGAGGIYKAATGAIKENQDAEFELTKSASDNDEKLFVNNTINNSNQTKLIPTNNTPRSASSSSFDRQIDKTMSF